MTSYPLVKPSFGSITADAGATQLGLYKSVGGARLAVFDNNGKQYAVQDCGPGYVGSYNNISVSISSSNPTIGINLTTGISGYVALGLYITSASYNNPVTVSGQLAVNWFFSDHPTTEKYTGIAISLTVPQVL